MRDFIRHPTDIPIHYKTIYDEKHKKNFMKNIGRGGLSFLSGHYIDPGTELEIMISIRKPYFKEKAVVVWSKKAAENKWEIGVKFLSPHSEFRARIIEEICHIEHYRKEVERDFE